jgi:ABC-type transport system substrate-binding protein
MDEFVSGISVTFDRNPNYWKDDEKFPGNRLPYVDRLVMLVMGDQATRLAALRSAQVDLSGWNGGAQITSISSVLELQKTNPDMQFFPIAFRSEVSSPMNICAGGPLSDVRVRHALQMAIDLETLNDNYFSGFGEWQPMGPIGPTWVGYHNAFDTWPEELKKFYSYDPEGAERLLDEAGYPRAADGVRFRTSILTNGDRSDLGFMELVAGYWKEIGVEADIEAPANATYVARKNEDWEGLSDLWSVGADYPDLFPIEGLRVGPGGRGGVVDPKFHAMWDEVEAAIGDEQQRLAKALDMYAIEQHLYLWGVRVLSFDVGQPWIAGLNGEQQLGACGATQLYSRMWIDSQLKAELN